MQGQQRCICWYVQPKGYRHTCNGHILIMEDFDFYIDEMVKDQDSSDIDWGTQYTCPNCGEPFDGHHCESCGYTEMFY